MLIEPATHEEKLPQVDPIIDIYSVIAKFLNGIKHTEPVIFPLERSKFIEVQTKLHEMNTGSQFFYNDRIKEFDAIFEGRLFTFKRIDHPQSTPTNHEQRN